MSPVIVVLASEEAGDAHTALAARLSATIGGAMAQLGLPADAEFSLVLADDSRLRELNRQYRSIDAATDVLSFQAPGTGDPDEPPYLGDVLVSVDRATVQATELGHSLEEELALLAVHGLLHLMGYDDSTDDGAARMEEMERTLGVRDR